MRNKTTFFRVEKKKNYTILNNAFLKRKDLSWKAKGILAYILSLPDDWIINIDEVMRHSTDGESSFRSGWKELRDTGYVKRTPIRDEKSKKIIRWETIVKEFSDERSHMAETHLVETHSVDSHPMENHTLLSTKELSTDKQSTESNKEQSSDDDLSIPKRFERVWSEYPKKQGKKKALASYKKAIKDGVTDQDIIDGIERYKKHLKNNKWLNIKQGSTWFNGEHWNDEFDDIAEENTTSAELSYLDEL